MTSDLLFCNNKQMVYDEACLHIKNALGKTIDIQYHINDCYECSFQPLITLFDNNIKKVIVKTTSGTILRFPFNNSYYQDTYFFEQHGHYSLNISTSVSKLTEISTPEAANGPLYTLLWTLIVTWVLWGIGSCIITSTQLFTRFYQPRLIIDEAENDLGAISRSGDSTPLFSGSSRDLCSRRRIKSLDAFRGIAIFLMIFVNYGGGGYWIFQHSTWNGLTIADVIFPWFAWIMGASIILSISSQLRNSISRKNIFLKVFLRSIALCAIGIVLNSLNNNNVTSLRFPGVLQRLALAYFIVGCLETTFLTNQNRYNITGRIKSLEDWIYGWIQWLIMLMLVGIYCVCTFHIAVPGCPVGYLGPGGRHMNSTFYNCTGGAAGFIDRQIFTIKHLYHGTLVSSVYQNSIPFDPEGLLGTLTTAFTVFLGVHGGRIILCYTTPKGRLVRWLILAVITGVISGFLCGWSKEGGHMPINKQLWSLSFALATSSLAFFMKSILFFTIDYKEWWSGSPFHQLGKNAIVIYIGSVITKQAIPWNWKPIDYSTHSQILGMNFWSTLLWTIIAVILDVINVHINI